MWYVGSASERNEADGPSCASECPRSSVGLEQQPSKLWVAGSNPAGDASFHINDVNDSRKTFQPLVHRH